MKKYFNVSFEFDRQKIFQTIDEFLVRRSKGFVCVVDGNVLATANKVESYNVIINSSIVNCCDGSSIAMLAGKIHNEELETFTGPELFSHYVTKPIKQAFIGNTLEVQNNLKVKLEHLGVDMSLMTFIELPFLKLEDFNYSQISKIINQTETQISWVSLGAPKQEMFNSLLLPYINSGILVGIGAGINLFLDEIEKKRSPLFIRRLKLEWFIRVLKEPKRIGFRAFKYALLLPKLIFKEVKIKKI
jgi:N-acetylglucosaminyldiphosphoundecaprenol N-acetyl-beta-D-mannosaminyltransferase